MLAIEPVPENVALLRRSILLNGYNHAEVQQVAIAERSGFAEMWTTPESNLCNLLMQSDELITSHVRQTHTGSNRCSKIMVPTTTLDILLKSKGLTNVDLIRMDLEGYELKATKGMFETFRQSHRPIKLIIEVHNDHFIDPFLTVAPWIEELFSEGFRPRALAVPGDGQGIRRDLPVEGFANLLCSYKTRCPHVLFVKGD